MRKSSIKSCSASKVTGLFTSKLVKTSNTRKKKKKREEKQQAEHAWVDLKVITGFCVVSQYESFLAVRDKKRRRSGWTTSCIFHSVFFFFSSSWRLSLSFFLTPSPFPIFIHTEQSAWAIPFLCFSYVFPPTHTPRTHKTTQKKKKTVLFTPFGKKKKRLSIVPKTKLLTKKKGLKCVHACKHLGQHHNDPYTSFIFATFKRFTAARAIVLSLSSLLCLLLFSFSGAPLIFFFLLPRFFFFFHFYSSYFFFLICFVAVVFFFFFNNWVSSAFPSLSSVFLQFFFSLFLQSI